MKKIRNVLLTLLSVACIGVTAVGFAGCTEDEETSSSVPTIQGPQGVQGIQGEKGDKGDTGAEGKSAYQIWLDNGNTGTEEDFLNWLKGLNDHTYGDWIRYTEGEDITCEQIIFYRVCATCNHIEWKHGSSNDHNWDTVTTAPTCQAQGYDTNTCTICGKVEVNNYTNKVDHAWATECSYDNSYHWYACGTCGETKGKVEHTPDETGACTVCTALVGATEGVVYDLSADGTYAEVIGYEGTAKRVCIADTYENVPVKTIYEEAFYNNDNITSVIIPDSVTTIGDQAFYRCTNLRSLVIGDGVTTIGEHAFDYCKSLTKVYITDITSWCNISGVSNLMRGEIYDNVSRQLYLDSELIMKLIIPDTVIEISEYAFYKCSSLTSVEIPDSVTVIGDNAFYCCGNLAYVQIGDNVTSIGDSAFSGCSGLASVEIPDGVTSISTGAFSGCSSLTSVEIPDSVTTISGGAFSGCSSLTSIEIPDSVTTISGGAFSGCSSLTSIEIPNGIEVVGGSTNAEDIPSHAFSNCDGLLFNEYEDCKYLGNEENPYLVLLEVKNTKYSSYAIHEDTKVIADYAFYSCSRLETIIIPDSVTTIGNSAFFWCSNLTSITFEGTVAEWNAISKGGSWNYNVPATEVVCKDGSVSL